MDQSAQFRTYSGPFWHFGPDQDRVQNSGPPVSPKIQTHLIKDNQIENEVLLYIQVPMIINEDRFSPMHAPYGQEKKTPPEWVTPESLVVVVTPHPPFLLFPS